MDEFPKYVVTDCAPVPEKLPDPTPWDLFVYWAYNFFRRPMVRKASQQMRNIELAIRADLDVFVFPSLLKNMKECNACRDAYAVLKPQIFLSQIELIFKTMACQNHLEVFRNFVGRNSDKFRRSEELAKYINGFS